MIRKLYTHNDKGTIAMTIPVKFVRELGLTKDDSVNVELNGNSLHVTKVRIE